MSKAFGNLPNNMTIAMPSPVERSTVMLNTSNYVSGSGNRYVYTLPAPFHARGANVSVQSISLYNSFFNISAALGNNYFTVDFLGTIKTFYIPDGFYNYSDVNAFVQLCCLQNNWYATSSSGSQFIYFLSITSNSVQYASQIDVFPLPTSSQASADGMSIPSGSSWTWPSVDTYPQLTICSGLQTLLGFNKQSVFPASTSGSTNLTFLSTTYPLIAATTSVIVCCNLVKSAFSKVPTILFQLPINVQYGNMISITQTSEQRTSIVDGDYTQIEIYLLDQNQNPLVSNDLELCISLIIEVPLI